MVHRFYPGTCIGIIGSGHSSALLAQEAGRLGYHVGSLVTQAWNGVRQFASWQKVVDSYSTEELLAFGEQVDLVYIEPGLLSNRDFRLLSQVTYLPLTDDLIAISTDRLIEKAYLDSNKHLVPPFSMVTNLEDILEAVEYIGYPCVLKSAQRNLGIKSDQVILFNEEDLTQVTKLLDQGTCILEAWIPVEKKVTLTIVQNEAGQQMVYPGFEVVDKGDLIGRQVRYPATVSESVQDEIERIGRSIAQSLAVVGAINIEYFMTSAGVIYVNHASLGLKAAGMFTHKVMSMPMVEATCRALVGLPLCKLESQVPAAIALPIAALNIEKVMIQYMTRTDWDFVFLNQPQKSVNLLEGLVVVTGEDLSDCDQQITITNLYHA